MRSSYGWLLVSLGCSLFSTAASAACDYYIAPTGSDSSGNGSMNMPWATINFASAKLSPGKTLCARGGTYYKQGGYIWNASGTTSAPVTFMNAPGEVPVFDGEWGATGTAGDFLDISGHSNIVINGLTIQHFADQYGNGSINVQGSNGAVSNVVIQNCYFYENGTQQIDHHVYIGAGVSNVVIRNNLFVRASGSAVQAYHPSSSGIQIYNNVMIGGKSSNSTISQMWGIIIGDAKDAQIYNNTIYGMQRGIDFYYGTTFGPGPYKVVNNLIINSATFGLRVGASYAPYYSGDYNDFYGNGYDVDWQGSSMTLASFSTSTTNDRHSLKVNPAFVSTGTNFHLTAGSPVINKGTSMASGMLAIDFDGNPRSDGAVDMGAYEFATPAASLVAPNFSTTYTALNALDARCVATSPLSVGCNYAVYKFCVAKGYNAGGYGPVEHVGDTAYVTCVNTGQAAIVSTTWSELSKFQSLCTQAVPMSAECSSAINRVCDNRGYAAGGFGPYISSAGAVSVSCVTATEADYIKDSSWAHLSAIGLGCNGQVQAPNDVCKTSVYRYCRSIKDSTGKQKYVSGYGILEMNASTGEVDYACLKY